MKDLILALLFTGIGLFFFSVACATVRFYLRKRKPQIGVKYGMIIDSDGRVKPQQRDVHQ